MYDFKSSRTSTNSPIGYGHSQPFLDHEPKGDTFFSYSSWLSPIFGNKATIRDEVGHPQAMRQKSKRVTGSLITIVGTWSTGIYSLSLAGRVGGLSRAVWYNIAPSSGEFRFGWDQVCEIKTPEKVARLHWSVRSLRSRQAQHIIIRCLHPFLYYLTWSIRTPFLAPKAQSLPLLTFLFFVLVSFFKHMFRPRRKKPAWIPVAGRTLEW